MTDGASGGARRHPTSVADPLRSVSPTVVDEPAVASVLPLCAVRLQLLAFTKPKLFKMK